MKGYFKLSQAAVTQIAKNYGTPVLVLSLQQLEYNYRLLAKHLPGVKLHYAVKANPQPAIIHRLAQLGSCFDVASAGEMTMLHQMGIAAERMVYANPIKPAQGLKAAQRTGVYKFTFDNETEISKMAQTVSGGTVLLRIRLDNPTALTDLNKKFGAPPGNALRLLRLAKEQGLDVAGLCFHVGSQTLDSRAYIEAIKICRQLFDAAAREGIPLRILDIGGGFPISTPQRNVDIAAIADAVSAALAEYFPATEIWAEPGRSICGTAVNLITRVIGVQERNHQQWYFLDDGLYGSFSGVIFDHWDYELETFKHGKKILATFAGPSCDSLDVMFRDKPTVPLAVDDLILVPACGAYTSASATTFNGFAHTPYVIWEEVCEEPETQLALGQLG